MSNMVPRHDWNRCHVKVDGDLVLVQAAAEVVVEAIEMQEEGMLGLPTGGDTVASREVQYVWASTIRLVRPHR